MSKEKCEYCDYWYKIGWGDGAEKVGIETAGRIAELEEIESRVNAAAEFCETTPEELLSLIVSMMAVEQMREAE